MFLPPDRRRIGTGPAPDRRRKHRFRAPLPVLGFARAGARRAGRPLSSASPAGRVAICPGSFDPLTLGHVDIIRRAARLFDRVVVSVLQNTGKTPLFGVGERLDLIRATFRDDPRVEAASFSGLLVDYARECGAAAIVRGIRALSDFEYEFQMALMNRRLAPQVETVFLTPAEEYFYVSSRLIKEIAALSGDVSGLVPEPVAAGLRAKFPPSPAGNAPGADPDPSAS